MTDLPRYWKPLIKLHADEMQPPRRELIESTMQNYKLDEAAARKLLDDEHAKCAFWVNDLYQVAVQPFGDNGEMLHINIRRRDGSTDLRDWRHFQQIKNEVAGPEREAFEMYPAESRKVDQTNKFHLWVLPEGATMGVGWSERDVDYTENKNVPGMRQRAL